MDNISSVITTNLFAFILPATPPITYYYYTYICMYIITSTPTSLSILVFYRSASDRCIWQMQLRFTTSSTNLFLTLPLLYLLFVHLTLSSTNVSTMSCVNSRNNTAFRFFASTIVLRICSCCNLIRLICFLFLYARNMFINVFKYTLDVC